MNAKEKFRIQLGQKIQQLRKKRGVSQRRLGIFLGLHQAAVSRIEKGQQGLTAEECLLICRYFECSLEELLGGDHFSEAVK